MNDVKILHSKLKEQYPKRFPGWKPVRIKEELAERGGVGIDRATQWYYGDIPAQYVDTFAELFDVDPEYLLGFQAEERRGETDTAAYIGMSESSVNTIRHLTDKQRATLEQLLTRKSDFISLLDNIGDCMDIHDQINDQISTVKATRPENRYMKRTPQTLTQKDIDNNNAIRRWINPALGPTGHQVGEKTEREESAFFEDMPEDEFGELLRSELHRLESLLNQQRPARMDIYDKLIGIVDSIAPRINAPDGLISDVNKMLAKYPETSVMTAKDEAAFQGEHVTVRFRED